MVSSDSKLEMDISDDVLWKNRDWDPSYLSQLFSEDFHDVSDLWNINVGDRELVQEANKVEKYSPIVEDISLDDESLCQAVENIEKE